MSKFKIGDTIVRTKYIADFPYGVEPLVVTKVWSWYGRNLITIMQSNQSWLEEDFELIETKQAEQSTPDRKLRLTEMQKEAIQAGINALYRHEESLKEQSYYPSLTYHIEICKYQQEVLRSMLREVNR
jgi:hypothetical protein